MYEKIGRHILFGFTLSVIDVYDSYFIQEEIEILNSIATLRYKSFDW